MTRAGPIKLLESDVDDLERIVLDLEFPAVRDEGVEILGRLRSVLATFDGLLSAVLPDGADDLLADPDAVLRRVRERLGEEPEASVPGPR